MARGRLRLCDEIGDVTIQVSGEVIILIHKRFLSNCQIFYSDVVVDSLKSLFSQPIRNLSPSHSTLTACPGSQPCTITLLNTLSDLTCILSDLTYISPGGAFINN
jgi:hypothetical protein